MAFGVGSRAIKNDINVTPLVDVVLVLLIIFMVVTPLLQRGKDVNLPKARTTDESKKAADPLVISIPADGSIWVETTRVDLSSLRSKLAEALARDPSRKILIKGDEALQVKDVRAVMADAKTAGAKGVALAVEQVKQ